MNKKRWKHIWMLVESALSSKCVACFAIIICWNGKPLVGFIAIQNMHNTYQAYPLTTFKSIHMAFHHTLHLLGKCQTFHV